MPARDEQSKTNWLALVATVVTILAQMSCAKGNGPASNPSSPTNPQVSQAQGGQDAGGGDASEIGVGQIRSDILKWINSGGSKALSFKSGMTNQDYDTAMRAVLKPHAVVVSFVTTEQEIQTSDIEQKVAVNGFRKSCRGFTSTRDYRSHILCNVERFPKTAAEQYLLIHHEFAGLAGVEKNIGASSDYEISAQISKLLKPELVYRLSSDKQNGDPNNYGFLKYQKWIEHIGQPYLAFASLEEKPCEGKMLFVDALGNHVLFEAKNTNFTPAPSGSSICGTGTFLETRANLQIYEGVGDFADSQMMLTVNENSNLKNPSSLIGDVFFVKYDSNSIHTDAPFVQLAAQCKNCEQKIAAELKRVLSPTDYRTYKSFHPNHKFGLKVLRTNQLHQPTSVTIEADLGGIGCSWKPGQLSIRTLMSFTQVGADIKVTIDRAKVSGDQKACLGSQASD